MELIEFKPRTRVLGCALLALGLVASCGGGEKKAGVIKNPGKPINEVEQVFKRASFIVAGTGEPIAAPYFANQALPATNSIFPVIDASLSSVSLSSGSTIAIEITAVPIITAANARSQERNNNFSLFFMGLELQTGFFEFNLSQSNRTASFSSASALVTLQEEAPSGTFNAIFVPAILNSDGSLTVGPSKTAQITITSVCAGILQVSLTWDTPSDLDLSIVDPDGNTIELGSAAPALGVVTESSAELGGGLCNATPATLYESFCWGSLPTSPPTPIGNWGASIINVDDCGGDTNWILTVIDINGVQLVRTGTFLGTRRAAPGTGEIQGPFLFQFPFEADLSIEQSVNETNPGIGDEVEYSISVMNANLVGANLATNIQVVVQIPEGLSFVSSVPSQGEVGIGPLPPPKGPKFKFLGNLPKSGGVLTWETGSLDLGESANLTYRARVEFGVAGEILDADARVSADQRDLDPSNDKATSSVEIEDEGFADIVVTMEVSNPTPFEGSTVVYTIRARNQLGGSKATGVKIASLLPAGLLLVKVDAPHGTYDSVTGIWDARDFVPGRPKMLLLTAKIADDAGGIKFTHFARLHSIEPPGDPIDENNFASATIHVRATTLLNVGASSNAKRAGAL